MKTLNSILVHKISKKLLMMLVVQKKRISWEEPEFSDNSGNVKLVNTFVKNNADYNVGTPHNIKYSIEDNAGNKAVCEFTIKIERKYSFIICI